MLQGVFQVSGLVFVILTLRGRDAATISLAISFWLQYQLRDLLNIAGLNANIFFGIDSESAVYEKTIFEILIFNFFLLPVVAWKSRFQSSVYRFDTPNRHAVSRIEDRILGYGALMVLIGAFIYFGGLEDRAGMILQKGSSLIYIASLVAIVYLCYRYKPGSSFLLATVALLSTQKLLILAYLIAYLTRHRSPKFIGVVGMAAALVVAVALVREPDLTTDTVVTFLAGTIFGHYESILPLYKLNEMGAVPDAYPIQQIFVTPFLEFFEQQEKFFERFNRQYFAFDGVLIAPSILGFFHYYFGMAAPFLAAVYVFVMVALADRIFRSIVGSERATILNAAFALLLLESSPDGLTFFLRLVILLVVAKVALRLMHLDALGRSRPTPVSSYV